MSDENTPQEDPNQNLKAEFNRKIENVYKANQDLAAQNEQLNAKLDALLNSVSTQQNKANESDMEDLKYTDPDKYIELKMQEVEGRVEKKITQANEVQVKKSQTLTKLASDYPEINDQNSDLYKRAIELAGNYDSKFVDSPEGIQLLVREAATELGILPKGKRAKEEEEGDTDMSEFIGGGGSGSGSGGDRKPKTKGDDLDPKTIVAAKLMGLDTNDPKVIERLKARAKRTRWTKYE